MYNFNCFRVPIIVSFLCVILGMPRILQLEGINSSSSIAFSTAGSTRLTINSNGTIDFTNNATFQSIYVKESIIDTDYPNTKILFTVANAITFQTNSLERLRIDTSGNVGIGTASGGGKLEVVGGRSFFSAASEQYSLGAKYVSTGGAVYFGATSGSATPDAVISNSGGSALMTLSNAGNVGFGTTSPIGFASYTTQTTYGTTGGIITFGQSNAARAELCHELTQAYLKTVNNLPLWFGTNNIERLRITVTGGISFGATGTAYGSSGQVLTSQGNAVPIWATYSTLTLNTSGTGLSGSTTYTPSGAATFTVTSNATSANTASTIVARDASGNFSAGAITATSLNNSGYILDNLTTTYGSFRVSGVKAGYVGTEYSYNSFLNTLMFDSGGNGGLYNRDAALAGPLIWAFYFSRANACLGIGTSATSSGYVLQANGSIYATANIVAYSDERIKKNWKNFDSNFIEKLSKVKNGIYDRVDFTDKGKIPKTQVGVSAQSLREVMPDAVTEDKDNDNRLGVSYGNAALAACIELAKEIVILRKEIEILKK